MYKRTNIELDVNLVEEAMEVSHMNSIKDVVHYSLKELIRLHKRKELLKLKGKVAWEGNLNELRC
jgi:Arc/MetJ family transcription regulator